MSKKKIIFTLFSVLVTIVVFTFLFQKITFSEVLTLILGINKTGLLIFIFLSLAMSIFRMFRYQFIINASGYRVKYFPLFLVVIVRNFTSDLLPARIGSLFYIVLVNQKLKIPLPIATSSFSLSLVFDIFVIFPMIAISLLLLGGDSLIPQNKMISLSVFCTLLSVLGIYYMVSLCRFAGRFFSYCSFLSNSFREKLENFFNDTAKELSVNFTRKNLAWLVFLSAMVRFSKYGALYFFLYALLQPIGYTYSDIPFYKVFLGISASEFAASLPISGIAGFGAYEGAWAFTFRLLGYPMDIASLTAVSHHLFTQIYGYSLGALAIVLLFFPGWKKIKEVMKVQQKLFFSLVALIVCFVTGAYYLYAQGIADPEKMKQSIASFENISGKPDIDIIFDSNRSGTFGIYQTNVQSGNIKKLVDDPNTHEMFPDISSDGQYLVFARTKSLSREEKGQIWLLELKTKKERQITDNGIFPSFSGDGTKVFFERERKKVMSYEISTGETTEIFPAVISTFGNYQAVKPRISADNKYLSFTSDKGGRWHAWAVDLKTNEFFQIGSGCQPIFNEALKTFIWVSPELDMLDGSGFKQIKMGDHIGSVYYDKDAPWGHLYFPRPTNDGKYLVYGAAYSSRNKSHEKDSFALFVKDLHSGELYPVTADDMSTNRWGQIVP